MQAAFYPTVRAVAGVPLDVRVDWAQTNSRLFTGASLPAADNSTKDLPINDIHRIVSSGRNLVPFGDRFFVQETQTGLITSGLPNQACGWGPLCCAGA